jgi:HEAT repeat protein
MPDPGAGTLAARLGGLGSPADHAERDRVILSELDSSDAADRDVAIAWAARVLEPERLTGLISNEANAALRNAALEALRRQGPYALQHLHARLSGIDADQVMFAIQTLDLIGSPASISPLLPMLGHPASNVAQVAAEALGRLKARSAVPSLIALLSGDLWLQLAAIEALGSIADDRAVTPLLQLFPEGMLAEPVAGALERIAAPEAAGDLAAVLGRPELRALWPATLRALAASLERHPDPAALLRPLTRHLESGELADFLGHILVPVDEAGASQSIGRHDDRRHHRGGAPEQRAAATLAIASGAGELAALVMALAVDPDWSAWAAPVAERHSSALAPLAAALLSHTGTSVRIGALRILPVSLLSLPSLTAFLRDTAPEVRSAACLALGRLGDRTAIPLLIDHLRSGTSEERTAAATALGHMPGKEVAAALASTLDPATPREVTLAALTALERVGDLSVETPLLELARSPAVELRRGALRALAALAGAKAEVALLRALADRDAGIQRLALDLLVRRGGEQVTRTFLMMLQANDSLRYHVIRALGRLKAAEAAPALEALFPDCPLHERLEVLTALGRIAAPGRHGFLVARLQDGDLDLRRAAAWAVAESAEPGDLPLLLELARHDDWVLRGEAARGLGRIGVEGARPALLELARDLERVVAAVAVKGLHSPATGGPG